MTVQYPKLRPFILDTLDQFGAKAMFFMVADNVRKHPELYEEVIRRGHKVGNHTYHHLGSFRHWALTYAVDVTKLTPYSIPLLPSATWLAAPYGVLVDQTVLPCRHVGPRYARLFEPSDGKGCGEQREEIRPKRVYYHLPRLSEEHR